MKPDYINPDGSLAKALRELFAKFNPDKGVYTAGSIELYKLWKALKESAGYAEYASWSVSKPTPSPAPSPETGNRPFGYFGDAGGPL